MDTLPSGKPDQLAHEILGFDEQRDQVLIIRHAAGKPKGISRILSKGKRRMP